MKVIGIDPGLLGGITIIEDGVIKECIEMPTHQITEGVRTKTTKGKKQKVPKKANHINSEELIKILYRHCDSDAIFIEEVKSIFGIGAASNFKLGYSIGVIHGVIRGLYSKDKMHTVLPKVWQESTWIDIDIEHKRLKSGKLKNDTKATSLNAAKRIFNWNFIPEGKRTPHDGMYDSALIAFHGYKTMESEQ